MIQFLPIYLSIERIRSCYPNSERTFALLLTNTNLIGLHTHWAQYRIDLASVQLTCIYIRRTYTLSNKLITHLFSDSYYYTLSYLQLGAFYRPSRSHMFSSTLSHVSEECMVQVLYIVLLSSI